MKIMISKASYYGTVRILFNRPQRSCGQGNIFAPVCHSVHRGVSNSVHAGIPQPPQEQTPPGSRHPLGADTPWSRHPREQTHPPGSRHPSGADTPQSRHPPEQTCPLGADTLQSRHPPEQTHPQADSPCLGTDTPPESRLQHTVNEGPVRILLECILV